VFFGHTSYRAYLDVYWIVFAGGVLAGWLSESRYRKLVDPPPRNGMTSDHISTH
jgi:hypothetical protein